MSLAIDCIDDLIDECIAVPRPLPGWLEGAVNERLTTLSDARNAIIKAETKALEAYTEQLTPARVQAALAGVDRMLVKCKAPHCWSEYGTPCGECEQRRDQMIDARTALASGDVEAAHEALDRNHIRDDNGVEIGSIYNCDCGGYFSGNHKSWCASNHPQPKQRPCYCGHTTTCDCGDLPEDEDGPYPQRAREPNERCPHLGVITVTKYGPTDYAVECECGYNTGHYTEDAAFESRAQHRAGWVLCELCSGLGQTWDGQPHHQSVLCTNCNGGGRVPPEPEPICLNIAKPQPLRGPTSRAKP